MFVKAFFQALILPIFASASLAAAEVVRLEWRSDHTSEPVRLQGAADSLLPAFRYLISTVPEAGVVNFALSEPSLLGLSEAQAQVLRPRILARYQLLAQSPEYRQRASHLPYCYAAHKPSMGDAGLYIPEGACTTTPVIVFLHGYGGSFLWYQHWLSEHFPDHLILCPAWGISSSSIPAPYVEQALAAAEKRLGFPLGRKTLIGLSAGGFGACRVSVVAPALFSQMICLGAYPPQETVRQFAQGAQLRFLVGAHEPFVVSGALGSSLRLVRASAPDTQFSSIPQADHFFMLTHPQETVAILKGWLGDHGRSSGK